MTMILNSDPFACFGELDFDLPSELPTWPPPGTANLIVEDRYEPLFTSATWTIVACVGGDELSRSSQASKAHSDAFLKRWARQLIRTKYELLRQLGVDVESEYVKWGGLLGDLTGP